MKVREQTYGRDDVIFREGDPSEAVYVVVSGRIELSKLGPEGPVILATLGPQEIFGEMGVFDDNRRSATARAVEKSRVKAVSKDDFEQWLQEEPGAALRVIGMLVARLRNADAIIAGVQNPQVVTGRFRGPRLIPTLRAWVRRRRLAGKVKASAGEGLGAPPLQIGVAAVNNDVEGGWSRALVGLFEGRPGIVVHPLSESLQLEAGADQAQVNVAVLKARQLLANEQVLDLLIWGDVHADGFTLWFTAAGAVDDERPGSFSPYFKLELPGEFEPPVGDLLALTTIAAIEPLSDEQRALQRQLLPAAVEAVGGLVGSLPVAWNMEQQRTALTAYGHAAATIAAAEGDVAWYDKAAEAYRAAVLRLPRDDHGMDEALLRRHLGGVLSAAADRRQEAVPLEEAVAEFRAAAECLLKSVYPQEWASAQNRLGVALYKLDLLTGQASLLKEAMTAFQAALQVFTRGEAPQRWADAMNNLAQVLQVYGDQVKSSEVLERAVEACRAALEFRPRDRTPMAWAASQNTLGTALFLLDKHRQRTDHLDEAATAFTGALEVFRQMGAGRPAAVAAKNLAHVQKLNKIRGERKVAMPDWADSEPG